MPSSRGDGAVTGEFVHSLYVSSLHMLRRNLKPVFGPKVEREGLCAWVIQYWLRSPLVQDRFTPGDVLH